MFESSSKNRKSWNGRQMVWQWIPNTWSNRWKWFGSCHGGFTWRNAYWERRRRAECSRRHIFWDERWKIGWLLRLEHSESNRGNFETNSVANRKPMQIRENRRNVAEPRILCDNSSKSILNTLKVSQIWNGCASQERVAEIKSGANYCCSYGFWSLNSKRSTNVTEGANMEITSLACFGHLLIKGHFWVKVNTQILNWCLKLNWRASNRDCFNWFRQSSKRLGSGVVKDNGLWLGRVQMNTVIQEPVMYSLYNGFRFVLGYRNWPTLNTQWRRLSWT